MTTNQVTLIGHLGADPISRTTTAGQTYVTARIAFSNRYTDRSGQVVDDTQWFDLISWGQTATRFAAELRRGARVNIEGRLTSNDYEDKQGNRRESVKITVFSFEPLPKFSELRNLPTDDRLANVTLAGPELAEIEEILPF